MPKRRKATSHSKRGQLDGRWPPPKKSTERSRSSLPGRDGSRKSISTRTRKSTEGIPESNLEETFHRYWVAHFPSFTPTLQYKFHPERQWRFDFAFVQLKIAIEIQGFGEGHNSYLGMTKDYEKHNEAVRHGWRILYFMSCHLEPTTIAETCHEIIQTLLGKPYVAKGINSRRFEPTIDQGRRRLIEGFNSE